MGYINYNQQVTLISKGNTYHLSTIDNEKASHLNIGEATSCIRQFWDQFTTFYRHLWKRCITPITSAQARLQNFEPPCYTLKVICPLLTVLGL